jgi:nucleoside-triphosphatase THEP1
MAKLNQLAQTQEQRVIVFGPPKVGKTELAGKLAEKYKILFFSLENGHSTLFKLPPEFQDRIEVINIRDSKEYPIAIETMLKVIKGKEVKICVAHSKVACPICTKNGAAVERVCLDEIGPDTIVVIDSITQLVLSAIAHITKNQPDDYKLQLDDWGNLKQLMEKFLSQVQVAKYNIVCISHEEEVKFEDGRVKIVPVGGSSNSSRNTAKYFDHVVYANVVNKKHVVGSATDYSTTVLTGSRTDVKLEANKEGGSLLDLFITWKLPNFGMVEGQAVQQGDVKPATPQTTQQTGDTRTPQQIALDNLRSKMK